MLYILYNDNNYYNVWQRLISVDSNIVVVYLDLKREKK